jgi:hypothetical protein
MSHKSTPEEMFEIATRLRAAGNEITRIMNPGLYGRALAHSDQARFEARCDEAQGLEFDLSDVLTCDICDSVLDDGECSECNS